MAVGNGASSVPAEELAANTTEKHNKDCVDQDDEGENENTGLASQSADTNSTTTNPNLSMVHTTNQDTEDTVNQPEQEVQEVTGRKKKVAKKRNSKTPW